MQTYYRSYANISSNSRVYRSLVNSRLLTKSPSASARFTIPALWRSGTITAIDSYCASVACSRICSQHVVFCNESPRPAWAIATPTSNTVATPVRSAVITPGQITSAMTDSMTIPIVIHAAIVHQIDCRTMWMYGQSVTGIVGSSRWDNASSTPVSVAAGPLSICQGEYIKAPR